MYKKAREMSYIIIAYLIIGLFSFIFMLGYFSKDDLEFMVIPMFVIHLVGWPLFWAALFGRAMRDRADAHGVAKERFEKQRERVEKELSNGREKHERTNPRRF